MKRIYIWGLVMMALAVSSCKLGKKYTRPELDLPENIDGVQGDTTSVSGIHWSELYQDTVLQNLIRQTLEYNKNLQAAAARVKEMMEGKRISNADLYPKIDAQVVGEYKDAASTSETYGGKGLLSWELDIWGKLRWGNQAALADYLGSVAGQRALRITLIAQVAQAYFELTALDQEYAIVKQTLAARQEGVRLARLRFEGGLTSETSLRQAQVELARTQTLIPDLEKNIRMKENQIALLAGQYPGPAQRGQGLEQQTLPATLPVGLPSQLLERRPDIVQAEYKLRAAHAKVGIAFTSLFPKITLTGKAGLESSSLSDFLKSPYYFFGGELLEPIFNMGKNRAKLRAAKAAREQEVYAYQQTVLTAFSEVSNALIASSKSREIRESRKKLEQASRSALDLATLQYINGITNYLDVLDAQRSYFDAQIGLNNAIRDELLTTVQLYKVLGGGDE